MYFTAAVRCAYSWLTLAVNLAGRYAHFVADWSLRNTVLL
jgi:hypothetical protein